MLSGAAIALWSIGSFVRSGRGTPAPFDAPRKFVASGPYRVVRNPMYIGGLTVLAGFALYLRSPAVLIFSAVWILFADAFVMLYEEPTLARKFGQEYEAYRRVVPRWFPRFVLE
jgi:protein-S-isoprenylcysteine O-methyltransferase Ste14